MSFKEIQVPVPWGFVAGKSWGDETKKLVLAFHGYQDNANSFDNLIPLLPKSFHYISFDFPSHGKSSHFKTEVILTSFDFILTMKLIIDYLKQEKYIIMGHCFGAFVAILFTHIYPECVEKLIALEAVHYPPTQVPNSVERMKWCINSYCKLNKFNKETAPAHTLEKATEKTIKRRYVLTSNGYLPSSISDESAATLLERGLEKVGNDKYKFANAQHLKYVLGLTISKEYEVDLIKAYPIKCPHLLILASEVKLLYDSMIEVVEAFQQTNENFKIYRVEGSHMVHLDNPEFVAEYINQFLLSNKL